MTHDEAKELLAAYLDEALDRETRRMVASHLSGCDECRAHLDEIAPIDLGEVLTTTWDTGQMRRVVRRSMLRTAVDTLLILVGVWLAAWAVSVWMLQPFIVNRGGRADAATVATADLAVMHNPGAVVTEYIYRNGLLSRVTEVDISLPVGSATVPLGAVDSRIGVLGFGDADGGRLFPALPTESDREGGVERLGAVADGTVATVVAVYAPAIGLDTAESFLGSSADVRVVWAGFEVAGVEGSGLAPIGTLGYGTCGGTGFPVFEFGSSGGGSGTSLGQPASLLDARDETRRAIQNLARHPDLLAGVGSSSDEAAEALERLETPSVTQLVLTGPTTEVIAFLDEAAPDAITILDIDFLSWSQPLCGR